MLGVIATVAVAAFGYGTQWANAGCQGKIVNDTLVLETAKCADLHGTFKDIPDGVDFIESAEENPNVHRGCDQLGDTRPDCGLADIFFHCTETVDLILQAEILGANGNDDSFWIRIDNSPPSHYSAGISLEFIYKNVQHMLIADRNLHSFRISEREDGTKLRNIRLVAKPRSPHPITNCRFGPIPDTTSTTATTTTNTFFGDLAAKLDQLLAQTTDDGDKLLIQDVKQLRQSVLDIKSATDQRLVAIEDSIANLGEKVEEITLVNSALNELETEFNGLKTTVTELINGFVGIGKAYSTETGNKIMSTATCGVGCATEVVAETELDISLKAPGKIQMKASCGDIDVCAVAASLRDLLATMAAIEE